MKRFPARAWGWIVWLFEKADIIPPLVIVSGWHYAGALANRDPLPVAIVLGILIDLGHYRSVKATIANNTWRRFIVMTVLTVMTGYYHWLWYKDIILSGAVPVLIICLSLLSKWGGWERQALRFDAPQNASAKVQDATQMQNHAVQDSAKKLYQCPDCGEWSSNAGNHARWCEARKARKDGGNG